MYVEMFNLGLRIHSSTAKNFKTLYFCVSPPHGLVSLTLAGCIDFKTVMSLK